MDGKGAHGPELAADGKIDTFFGSATSEALPWLQIDLGAAAPFFDQLKNLTIYQRKDAGACMDMLRCYKIDLSDEDNVVSGRSGWLSADLQCAWSCGAPSDLASHGQMGKVVRVASDAAARNQGL